MSMYKMEIIVGNYNAIQHWGRTSTHTSHQLIMRTLKEGDWVLDLDPRGKRYGNVAMKVIKFTPKTVRFRFIPIHPHTDYKDEMKNYEELRFNMYPKIPHYMPTGAYIIPKGKKNDMDAFMFTHWSDNPVFDDLKTLGQYVEYISKKKHTRWSYGEFFLEKHQTECVETIRCLVRTKIPVEIKKLITEWL